MSDRDRIATLVATAYDTETFRPTLAEVRRRVRGRLRRRLPAFLAALALLLAGGAGLTLATSSDRGFSGMCASFYRQSHKSGPMPRLAVADGGAPGIRLYDEGNGEAFVCIQDGRGVNPYAHFGPEFTPQVRLGTSSGRGRESWIRVYDEGGGLPGATTWYGFGAVPTGTTRVEVIGDGATVRAALRGTWFAVIAPRIRTATVTVRAIGPWGEMTRSLAQFAPGQCGQPGGGSSTVIAEQNKAGGTVVLTGDRNTIHLCVEDMLQTYTDTTSRPVTALAHLGGDSWYVAGRMPADATAVTVDLSDGSTANAFRDNGYYLAFDPLGSPATVLRVHVVTPERTYAVEPGP